MPPLFAPASDVITVAQLNRRVASLLQESFPRLWVRGEVSNFTQAASGHWYFSIKDASAAVRAVMFRRRAESVGFVPRPGERFEFCVSVTLYEPRGDYQVQVETMRRAGQGDLHEAFLRLKQRLDAEGLFDPARKRVPNPYPQRIGVVTSLAAAALRDVLSAMARRSPHVQVVVYPAPVQGADAPPRLVQALEMAGRRAEVDTLLLVRGGGSLEDLWSFNDEVLARAIAASPIPVIAGVGHETDFTIADFVADVRAPTPTAAAELCCRARDDLLEAVRGQALVLARLQQRQLERCALRLDRALAGLVSPAERLARQREQLSGLVRRLDHAVGRPLMLQRERLAAGVARLRQAGPGISRPARQRVEAAVQRLARSGPDTLVARRQLARLGAALQRAFDVQHAARRREVMAARQTLLAVDPRRIVQRGYAIVRRENGEIIKNALDLSLGEQLAVELAQGSSLVRVLKRTPQ